MSKTTSLTKEQFTKLECDAHAFLQVARLVEEHLSQMQPEPMSTAYISLSTAMITNIGMGFELKLKAIHYKATGFIPHTHELVKIYDSLDSESIKSRLTDIYQKCLKDTPPELAVAHVVSKGRPRPPRDFQAPDFRGFLNYLDSISLYDRRYSFENFSNHEWWIVIKQVFFAQLFSRITEFTNSLPEPSPL